MVGELAVEEARGRGQVAEALYLEAVQQWAEQHREAGLRLQRAERCWSSLCSQSPPPWRG